MRQSYRYLHLSVKKIIKSPVLSLTRSENLRHVISDENKGNIVIREKIEDCFCDRLERLERYV